MTIDTPHAVLRYAIAPGPLGLHLVGLCGGAVAVLLIGDSRAALVAELGQRFAALAPVEDEAGLAATLEAVADLLAAPGRGTALALAPSGTAFQRRVWRALRTIPAGRTLSYGALARQLGAPTAARAVAQACAANPIAVAIPCHRVVRGDGEPGGYRWGALRKRRLLQAEAAL